MLSYKNKACSDEYLMPLPADVTHYIVKFGFSNGEAALTLESSNGAGCAIRSDVLIS